MSLQIEIPDDKINNLSDPAKSKLSELTEKYTIDVINEANRIEAELRSDNNDPEITGTIIQDAVLHLKRHSPRNRRFGFVINQIFMSLSTLFTGILFNIKEFQQDATCLVIFLVVLAIAIVTTTIHFIYGRTK